MNQVHVVGHDLQVVGLVNLTFNFETLLERVHGVLQELLLVLILLLDVRVHIAILCALVLNESVQTLVEFGLELSMVISVLDYLVHSVLEVIDIGLVIANLVSVGRNRLGNQSLSYTEVLDHETKRGVDRIVLIQLLVERTSSVPETGNLKFFRCYVLPEIANLFIEHELELFQLLSLLLQM